MLKANYAVQTCKDIIGAIIRLLLLPFEIVKNYFNERKNREKKDRAVHLHVHHDDIM